MTRNILALVSLMPAALNLLQRPISRTCSPAATLKVCANCTRPKPDCRNLRRLIDSAARTQILNPL